MSRIGKKPVSIPGNVKVAVSGNTVSVEGPKGKLEHKFPQSFKVEVKDGKVFVASPSETKADKTVHGLTRSIIENLIKGVADGYTKELEIRGVGFKAQVQGANLVLNIGFSHPVQYAIPEGVVIAAPKPTQMVVSGIDKVKVGEVAAEVRGFFEPEPYTGKGIRYVGEYVRHKAGKKV